MCVLCLCGGVVLFMRMRDICTCASTLHHIRTQDRLEHEEKAAEEAKKAAEEEKAAEEARKAEEAKKVC